MTGQVMRSATSAGANYEETRGAESRADFLHKSQLVLKELRETRYWLRLMHEVEMVKSDSEIIPNLIKENNELMNIIAKSIVTAKSR
ncbi:MAG: four helix bundle protein [Candidatus Zixiibacteriota bacterium]|nr:MAG: four helix bundle protein [candidate division Zixibacteria bacterium]